MTTTPTPLPPLAEVLNKKADEATPLELAMSAYDTAADLAAPYDAERARLRDENARLRARVAGLLRDNRHMRAYSRRLRETIGEVVGAIEGDDDPGVGMVANMAAEVVAERDRLRAMTRGAS